MLQRLALTTCICLSFAFAPRVMASDGADEALLRAGERMYREGIAPSGQVMKARLHGDVPLRREQAACVSCHRRSGLGSSEGQSVALPVTGDALYSPRDPSARQLAYLARHGARRPAYDDATLARAIRDGIDAAGNPLAHPMPRYKLSDAEMKPLIAYLKSLAVETAPGVSAEEIHFAVVVSDGVPHEKRESMLAVIEAYVRDKNGGTRYERRRMERGPWTMTDYRAYRNWRVHAWRLAGAPETWPKQLADHYRQQPVFALLGGVAAGPWQPVHAFCEENRIPCLFPSTELPVVAESDFYPLYFSEGMTLEAKVLARHFRDEGVAGPIIQFVDGDAESAEAAHALRAALGQWNTEVEEVLITAEERAAQLRNVLAQRPGATVVLWSRHAPLHELSAEASRAVKRIVISSTLHAQWPQLPDHLTDKVVAVHPFVLPEQRAKHLTRVRAWLRAKGIRPGDERLQADTYFALTTAGDALMQIANVFSREYFVERIEDMVDNAVTTSIYPRLSLGPNQRFAAKGAYIVPVSQAGGSASDGTWIVP